MTVLRTPDECFENIPDFPYQPKYSEIQDSQLGTLRLAYIDEGPEDGQVILCMHGEPSWSFLYRKMIPVFVEAGFRVIAPDLIGFGRSDKPTDQAAYTYNGHVQWMTSWFNALELTDVTLVAQDWGGFIGLRLLSEMPDKFSRVSISNTAMPEATLPVSDDFMQWREFSQTVEVFDAGFICNVFDQGSLTEVEKEAYRAPFPSDEYLAGARQFPTLVPITPNDPSSEANINAWKSLSAWEKPMLLCFSDSDPISAPWKQPFLDKVPGAQGQPHITLNGHHFIQEEDGVRWANTVIEWIGG